MAYDRFVPDEYTRRLAQINQSNPVMASVDIYNSAGALLAGKGTEISASVADKILKHRLAAALEEQVALTRSISADELFEEFQNFFRCNDDCERIQQVHGDEALLREMCQAYAGHPLLVQKFTVFATELRTELPRSLFCAWFGLLLCKRLKLPLAECRQVFLAALLQDVGLLHLAPEALTPQGDARLIKMYRSHPVIAAAFAKLVPTLPREVAELIQVHHENFEGTGIPFAKAVQKMPLLAQLTVACNLIFDCQHGIADRPFLLGQLLPALRVYSTLYNRAVFGEAFVLVSHTKALLPQLQDTPERFRQFVSALLFRYAFLVNWFKEVQVVTVKIWEATKGKHTGALINLAQSIRITVSSSGVLSEGMVRWVSHVEENVLREAAEEMQDIYLLQWILEALLVRFMRCLESLEQSSDPAIKEIQAPITKALRAMVAMEKHLRPQSLTLREEEEVTFNLESLFAD